jgi:hypothetical protein
MIAELINLSADAFQWVREAHLYEPVVLNEKVRERVFA